MGFLKWIRRVQKAIAPRSPSNQKNSSYQCGHRLSLDVVLVVFRQKFGQVVIAILPNLLPKRNEDTNDDGGRRNPVAYQKIINIRGEEVDYALPYNEKNLMESQAKNEADEETIYDNVSDEIRTNQDQSPENALRTIQKSALQRHLLFQNSQILNSSMDVSHVRNSISTVNVSLEDLYIDDDLNHDPKLAPNMKLSKPEVNFVDLNLNTCPISSVSRRIFNIERG